MKKFVFRLQAVLDMRQNELEKKQLEIASIVNKLNKQIEQLKQIQEYQAKVAASLDDICNAPNLDITTISSSNGYLLKLGNEVVKQVKVIENTKNILKIKQMELQEMYKKVKVLEKLKEKQETAYYKMIEEKSVKEIDDIVTTRYKVS